MVDDIIRLRDVVQVEIEQLEEYGEAAGEFFHALSGDIRREFTSTLETLVTQDLAAFQSQVNRSLANTGLGNAAGAIGGAVGDVLGEFLPENVFGDVFGAAVGGALRSAARDFARNGDFDINRAVNAANRSGNTRLNTAIRKGDLPLSRGQKAAEVWSELSHGQRNL